jgi:hypothetical protein
MSLTDYLKGEGTIFSLEAALKGSPYLMSGNEAIYCMRKVLEGTKCLKTLSLILEHILMERLSLDELTEIQDLILNTNYEAVINKQAMFFDILIGSIHYLTIYILLKVWRIWVCQGMVSGDQTIRLLTELLEKREGLPPPFRLKVKYALSYCQGCLGIKKNRYYGWPSDMEMPNEHSTEGAVEDAFTVKLIMYMKKLIGTPNQMSSRLLRERLSICMQSIRQLSRKTDEHIHEHILSILAEMKSYFHLLPRAGMYRYMASCAPLKRVDYVINWMTVCKGLLERHTSDWLEDDIMLESLEYYAKHTVYPHALMKVLQEQEAVREKLINRLKTAMEEETCALDWECYGHVIVKVHGDWSIHPEENILFRLKQWIEKKKEINDLATLKKLFNGLEKLLMELQKSIKEH